MSDEKYTEFITFCTEEESGIAVKGEVPRAMLFRKYGHAFETDPDAETLFLCRCRYTPEETAAILREAEEWEIYAEHTEGYDMGYGTSDETDTDYTMPVPQSIILVADGHFAGVADTSRNGTCTQPEKFGSSVHVALIRNWNGEPMFYAGSSEHFSSDDHESWSSTSYYLRKKA